MEVRIRNLELGLVAVALLAAAALSLARLDAARPQTHAPRKLEIRTLSADAGLVTGGDALVEISLPESTTKDRVTVTVDRRDVTGVFQAGATPHTWIGLVTGLANGKNLLSVDTRSVAQGSSPARQTPSSVAQGSSPALQTVSLEVVNYPITGPVISGPWIQPFICQTDAYKLPDGTLLGPALDANCSARTVVQYIYWTSGTPGAFKPLSSLTTLPPDVAKTTTLAGDTVNFIVRVETGTMNRGIYQNAVLHDPTSDPPPTPFSPPKGWNRRLVALHGAGCPSGWYIQGGAQGANILDRTRLGQGYALFINTLNHPTNSCNAFLAGETTMMGKEHFIETFGVPFYTISTGSSGGAYTSLQIADAFPGLFDGISLGATFPDALSIALAGLDAHLLTHYFAVDPHGLTDAQKAAIGGYHSVKAMVDAANQAQRTDPVPDRADIAGYLSARWNAAVPVALRYHPVSNPKGARPTIFDAARNIYGTDPGTGAALRPFDNVGVQYGLNALNSGAITTADFLDLNEKIGGYDRDANYVAARSTGDAGAIQRAYQSGLLLGGNGGLASIPIIDNATSNEAERYHYGWFHFAVRDRIRKANGGSSDNMVMWRSTSPAAAQALFDEWMVAYKSDRSAQAQRAKVLHAKPASGRDGCYDLSTPPRFIAEDLVFSRNPVSQCSTLFPVYSNTRREAGGPLAADVLKCQLKPVDPQDYRTTLSSAELGRLKTIFPTGVCDWAKPGVNQVRVVTWASFGPSPKNQVFDITK